MEFSQAESALLEALVMASGQNVTSIKSAEVKLGEWEKQPGYYSAVMKIVTNHSIDSTVRWLAVNIVKNGVDKYWRKTAENAIQEEEKCFIRTTVLTTFEEPVNIVGVQISVLISRIARFDCPKEWPSLIPNLIETIKSNNSLIQYRGLETFNLVVKALISKRLPGDKTQFEMISAEIYSFILNCWNTLLHQFFLQVQNNDSLCQVTLAKALLALKILRRLTIHGFKQPHESQEVMAFVGSIFERIKDIFLTFGFVSHLPRVSKVSEKVISCLMMVLVTLLEIYPYSFVSFVQPSLEFVFTYIFLNPTEILFNKFIIECLNLMKGIIQCREYKRRKYNNVSYLEDNTYQNEITKVDRIKTEFFKKEVLEKIFTELVSNYFLLNDNDLQLWIEDSENFALTEFNEPTKFCLRPCSHSLFMALLHEHRDILTSFVVKLIQNDQQIIDPQDLKSILKRDAVYCSVGLCAFDLYDEIDFDQWFSSTLVQELAIKEPNYRIIRRRIVWLIGKWSDVKPTEVLKAAICSNVIPLLQESEDLVVRLTTAEAVQNIFESGAFTLDQFSGYLGPLFYMLFNLLREVQESSIKLQILNTMSSIINSRGEDIRQYSLTLVQYLSLSWEESGEDELYRCGIVSTLIHCVKVLAKENQISFLYPVIECCTDVKNDTCLKLHGLDLWLTVMQYSSDLTPELVGLLNNMPHLLENSSGLLDSMKKCCSIIEAYILLNPEKFLTECGGSLITVLTSLLSNISNSNTLEVIGVVEMMIKAHTEIGTRVSMPILVTLIEKVCDKKNKLTMSFCFAILSRILLYSKDLFSQVLEKAASAKSCTVEHLFEQILFIWNKFVPLESLFENKKLYALALCSLLTVQSNIVVSQFSAIVKNAVEALNDITEIEPLSGEPTSLNFVEDKTLFSIPIADYSSPLSERRAQLYELDPIYNVELKKFFQSQFNELRNLVGSDNFESLLQTLDAETIQECRLYIFM